MEVDSVIIGSKLSEIKKTPDEVKLVFENSKTGKGYVLSFRGLLFETSGSTLNKKVRDIQLKNGLGFRATSQLRYLRRDPNKYRQFLILMEGSNDRNKLELLGAYRNFKILPKRRIAVKGSSTILATAKRRLVK